MTVKRTTATESQTAAPDVAAAAAAAGASLVDHSEPAPAAWEGQEDAANPEEVETVRSNVPAKTHGGSLSAVNPDLNTEFGVDGSDLGFGSFDQITLKDDRLDFKGQKYDSIKVVVKQGKKKFLYKVAGSMDKKLMFYSNDDLYDSKGLSIKSRIAEWKAQGHVNVERKEYLEVVALIVSCTKGEKEDFDLAGEIGLCSIPPASKGRFTGYVSGQSFHNRKVSECVTQIKAGKQVLTPVPFYPWDFKFVGMANG